VKKRLLIISPYFAPVNAADMQRIRMSLPYFKENDWEVEIVMIHESLCEMVLDPLLLEHLPPDITIHKIGVISKKITSKFGLGSIGIRSLWHYRRKVDLLLKSRQYDLIYFSTTQFPVISLGPHWRRKFGVPFVVDMQDPWHSEYYKNKPRAERPPKYWFAYRLNKLLEAFSITKAAGIISVSEAYITTLRGRYPELLAVSAETITFGAYAPDMDVARANGDRLGRLLMPGFKNIVYIGRGGLDMRRAIEPVFVEFKKLLEEHVGAANIRFYFIGTSYAPAGQGKATILPIAEQFGVADYVTEHTDRISYYQALATLQEADALFIPGSDDPAYTASKIYPYILAKKPLLAVFNPDSPALSVLREFGLTAAYDYRQVNNNGIASFITNVFMANDVVPQYNESAITKYSAREMTRRQCSFFDKVLNEKN